MLKRFMTWLLNQLQTIITTLGRKRSGSRKTTADAAKSNLNYAPEDKANDSDITIAERSPYVPLVDTASPDVVTTLPNPTTVSSNSPAVVTDESSRDQTLNQDLTGDVSVRQQLDVASASGSISEVEKSQPRFPTEVSALLSPYSDGDDETDVPVHPIRKLPDEQLPVIQDLLPAVGSESTSVAELDDHPESSLAQDSDEQPDPVSDAADADQPVLFSFDIVENDNILEESIEPPSSSESSTPLSQERSVSDQVSDQLDDQSNPLDSSPIPNENIQIELKEDASSLQDSHLGKLADQEEDSNDKAPEATADKPQLLYSQDDAALEESSANQHPVKRGTIKLLFTLKKGNFHGYIAPDDGSKDILFHQKYINADIFPKLERGSQVTAAVKYIEGKAYATRVDLL